MGGAFVRNAKVRFRTSVQNANWLLKEFFKFGIKEGIGCPSEPFLLHHTFETVEKSRLKKHKKYCKKSYNNPK